MREIINSTATSIFSTHSSAYSFSETYFQNKETIQDHVEKLFTKKNKEFYKSHIMYLSEEWKEVFEEKKKEINDMYVTPRKKIPKLKNWRIKVVT